MATLLHASDDLAATAADEGFLLGAETAGTALAVVPVVTTGAAAEASLVCDFLGAIANGNWACCGGFDEAQGVRKWQVRLVARRVWSKCALRPLALSSCKWRLDMVVYYLLVWSCPVQGTRSFKSMGQWGARVGPYGPVASAVRGAS